MPAPLSRLAGLRVARALRVRRAENLSAVFQEYTNEFFAHRKDAKGAEKMVFCSGGEGPPEQKPPPL